MGRLRKWLAALALAGALGLSLAACGGGTAPVATDSPAPTDSPALESTPAPTATPAGLKTAPNVIVILAESFSDLTALDGIAYDGDPVAEFHRAQTEGVSGTFYTQSLGYGTCAVEMQVLTGVNATLLPEGTRIYEWEAEQFSDFPSLPRIFDQAGYFTAYLHTFNDSIYNRTPVHEQLGFEQIVFSDGFASVIPEAAAAENYWAWMGQHVSGEFYSDDLLADGLIALCEREEAPVFVYGATMENHQPYDADKYAEYDFPFTADLSEGMTGSLNALTQGTASGSRMLGRLMDYFSASDEPTVILFFGDHRPGMGLGWGETLYSELGLTAAEEEDCTLEELGLLYTTDYVIWANDEALLPAPAGTKMANSCDFLGLSALEAAGLADNSWWAQVAALREEYLTWNRHYCAAPDGGLYATAEDCLDGEGLDRLAAMKETLYTMFDVPDPAPETEE